MSTHIARPAVDVAPSAPARPRLALALALLSVPGVTITWDISGAAGFAGTAVGIAAIILGLQARSRLAGQKGARMATVAVGIATLAVLSVVFFLIVGAPDCEMLRTADTEAARGAALRAAAVACGSGSPLQAAAAAPLWHALSCESALWMLAPLPPARERRARPRAE
jgi:hypothetical protein